MSNGRLAVSGESLRVESAFMLANAADGQTGDRRLGAAGHHGIGIAVADQIVNDSPMAWADEAQAETVAKLGPLSPYRIDTMPGGDVGNEHRNEERRDPVGTLGDR